MTSVTSDRLWPLLHAGICLLIIIFLISPMVIVVIVSFSSAPFLTFPPPGLSLQWYRKLASLPVWIDAISTSLKVMVPSALIATAAGTAAAVGLARGRIPGAGVIASLIMAPMVVPVIITAAAMLGVFRAWGLQGTLLGLILAHATLAVPYVVFTVLAAMRLVDDQLESAALTLGATRWQAFWRVTFPLILPALLSGMLFAMVISFDELVVSIFLSTPTMRTVTVQMWSDVRGDVDPTIAAIGALLLAFSVGALLLETVLNRQRTRPLAVEAGGTAAQQAAAP
jgi:putative spermidine/putrescine transport system permease protein